MQTAYRQWPSLLVSPQCNGVPCLMEVVAQQESAVEAEPTSFAGLHKLAGTVRAAGSTGELYELADAPLCLHVATGQTKCMISDGRRTGPVQQML